MPTIQCYVPRNANAWTSKGKPFSKIGQGRGKHAEVLAFEGVVSAEKNPVVKFESDAFPCSECDNYLITKTKNSATLRIIVEVSEDGSFDRRYHEGLGLAGVGAAPYPVKVYYAAGGRTYNAAPANW